MRLKGAVSKIEKNGVLLVFPINNKAQPNSLWREFYPGKKMNWEWDESGDNRVFDMWALMKRLSEGGEVVYSKWYQGRATFFSKTLFAALIRQSFQYFENPGLLSRPSREILEVLEQDSPLSTKKLKQICELQGKDNARIYDKAVKELFSHFLIVGYGEVDDGAFPSLAIGASKSLFEELYVAAASMSQKEAAKTVDRFMPEGSLFRKHFEKLRQRTSKEKEVE